MTPQEAFLDYLEQIPKGSFYTGVGSRETPENVGVLMCAFAIEMRLRGLILRSGAADGADLAFESGATPSKEIYLPYPRFNGADSAFVPISKECYDKAKSVHPAWDRCSDFAKSAHARNAMQVMGKDLSKPSEFLVCWTKDGAISEATAHQAGGTRTAIVLAERQDLLILNLNRKDHFEMASSVVGNQAMELAKKNVRMKGSRQGVFKLPTLMPSDETERQAVAKAWRP